MQETITQLGEQILEHAQLGEAWVFTDVAEYNPAERLEERRDAFAAAQPEAADAMRDAMDAVYEEFKDGRRAAEQLAEDALPPDDAQSAEQVLSDRIPGGAQAYTALANAWQKYRFNQRKEQLLDNIDNDRFHAAVAEGEDRVDDVEELYFGMFLDPADLNVQTGSDGGHTVDVGADADICYILGDEDTYQEQLNELQEQYGKRVLEAVGQDPDTGSPAADDPPRHMYT